MSQFSRKVYDCMLVMSLLSIPCFGDPTIHVDKHQSTWKSALDRCAGRGEQLLSIQNLSDKDKERLLSKLENHVPFWTMSMNISQVVAWAGCVQEISPRAFSLQDIRMSTFGSKLSLPKCLGYCLRIDKYAAVGLKVFPTGEMLTAEEELLSTGKCVYFVNDANKHFNVSSCDMKMRGFVCQTRGELDTNNKIFNIQATWQEANMACRKANMSLFWDHHKHVTGSSLWTGFFVSPTTTISPDYNAKGRNCPVILKTHEGNLNLGRDDCEHSHHYLCIQDKKSVAHTGSSDRGSQIVGAVLGSLVAIVIITAVAIVIYRHREKRRGKKKMIFDNRMYQEVMETDRSGCRPPVRNESNQVSNIPCEEKRVSNIYAAYAEITLSSDQVEANPILSAANSKIPSRVHGECLHYASSNIAQLTGYTHISTITEQSGSRQAFIEDNNKPVVVAEKQTDKEYETIF
ncbi:hypothetical protein ACJMK2_022293 [Sinanodonta woodiana]|uniref:C-type lectin domain-containing protein n=1 Tax=Sinanodonta woodiana TaxID=1069815 RepID=A0ABD3TIL4_SINWO